MSIENEMLVQKLFSENQSVKNIRPVAKKYIDRVSSGESLTLKNTVGDTSFNFFNLYGESWQNTTTGQQLYDVSQAESSVDFTVVDDWVTVTYDNTDNESVAYKGFYTPSSSLVETNKTYALICEVATVSGGYIVANSEYLDYYKSQFTPSRHVKQAGTHVFQITARDDFSDCNSMLQTQIVANPNEVCECTFRLSVIAGTSVTADTFAYEPFTGGTSAPSLTYPQEINNIGNNGKVTLNIADGKGNTQSIDITTPNGLPGLPVLNASNANYTDSSGRMWCCDEVDYEDGVYIKRIESFGVNTVYYVNNSQLSSGAFANIRLPEEALNDESETACMASSAIGVSYTNRGRGTELYRAYINATPTFASVRYPASKGEITLEQVTEDLVGMNIKYILKTPVEIPLTDEELDAFYNLTAYEGTTQVFNSENAYMSIGYKVPLPKRSKISALKMWFRENPII